MNDIVNLQYPCQLLFLEHVILDRGVTTALMYSFIAVLFFHCIKCGKNFGKHLWKQYLQHQELNLNPALLQVPNPVNLPLQVLRMHRQHAADYTKLMMESGIDFSMDEDRAALLITEVCSSMPTS